MLPDLSQVETATLGQFLTDGFMAPAIQALIPGRRIWGPALTVRLPGADGSALIEALSVAEPGAVVVVDRCGDLRHACLGALSGTAALERGVAGLVIDGFVTDISTLIAIGLPVWCRGRSPLTTRNQGMSGHIGGIITCGGAQVRTGDVILADESGVVVLDPAKTADAAATALRHQAEEAELLRRIRAGEALNRVAPRLHPEDRLRHPVRG